MSRRQSRHGPKLELVKSLSFIPQTFKPSLNQASQPRGFVATSGTSSVLPTKIVILREHVCRHDACCSRWQRTSLTRLWANQVGPRRGTGGKREFQDARVSETKLIPVSIY
jgi:hypothetical protein